MVQTKQQQRKMSYTWGKEIDFWDNVTTMMMAMESAQDCNVLRWHSWGFLAWQVLGGESGAWAVFRRCMFGRVQWKNIAFNGQHNFQTLYLVSKNSKTPLIVLIGCDFFLTMAAATQYAGQVLCFNKDLGPFLLHPTISWTYSLRR